MRNYPRWALWCALVSATLFAACSYTPRLNPTLESDYLRALRTNYLKNNPDGVHNAHIVRGEVVRGMEVLEVVASWGHPAARKAISPVVEEWYYISIDEDSKDVMQYTFRFRKSTLSDWTMTRLHAKGGIVELPDKSFTLTRGVPHINDPVMGKRP